MNCASWDYQFDSARSWGQYFGTLRSAILHLRHRKNIPLGEFLARVMLSVLDVQSWKIDIVVPIPLAPHRLVERGYNQAELLAQPIAESFPVHYPKDSLIRSHETVKQFELTAKERWENLLDAFSANTTQVAGAKVLIVDDIMTTGATLNAAATALKKAGAAEVYALTLAKTLLDEEQG
jgi:ComF family protein